MRTLDPASCADADVLLLAPHPDDETLGCGGLACLLAAAGARVTVLVLARGDGGVDGTARASTRQAEARAACAELGLPPPVFAGLASADLRADPAAAAGKLRAALGQARFDLLLVPSPLERHETHRAALLAALLAGVARPAAAWWGYGVWDAIPAGAGVAEVDVTPVRAAKARAMAAHASQNAGRPLAAAAAARDLSQAVFSRIRGEETRRAVERLLDLSDLAAEAPAAAAAARAEVGRWLGQRARLWAQALWGTA